jgi:TolA-binding protein
MKPLKDLADAFRQNTETLQSIAEGQARLGRRMERSDRSEAVISSTQALNDTFRGVKRTQEQLIGRLSKERRRPWQFLAASFVAAAVVIGGGLWVLLSGLAERDESAARGGAEAFTGALSERDSDLAKVNRENRELSVDLATARTRMRDLDERVTELSSRVEALATENANLERQQAEMADFRRENDRLLTENGRLEDELTAARRELKAAREELAASKDALAKAGNPPSRAPAAEPANVEPAEPSAVPPGAVTDTAELDRVRSVLNRLLSETAGGAYRVERIGGLRGKMLYDVVIVDGRVGEREAKKFEAKEARIAIDAARKRIEIRLRSGHITYYGVRARFWDDRYVLPLTDVETDKWVRSGLTIFESA